MKRTKILNRLFGKQKTVELTILRLKWFGTSPTDFAQYIPTSKWFEIPKPLRFRYKIKSVVEKLLAKPIDFDLPSVIKQDREGLA